MNAAAKYDSWKTFTRSNTCFDFPIKSDTTIVNIILLNPMLPEMANTPITN